MIGGTSLDYRCQRWGCLASAPGGTGELEARLCSAGHWSRGRCSHTHHVRAASPAGQLHDPSWGKQDQHKESRSECAPEVAEGGADFLHSRPTTAKVVVFLGFQDAAGTPSCNPTADKRLTNAYFAKHAFADLLSTVCNFAKYAFANLQKRIFGGWANPCEFLCKMNS